MAASPTKVSWPRPPMAAGWVNRYQSVWTSWSSICVAALAAPKRKLPLPDACTSEPGVGYRMSGGGTDASGGDEDEPPHAASVSHTNATILRPVRYIIEADGSTSPVAPGQPGALYTSRHAQAHLALPPGRDRMRRA